MAVGWTNIFMHLVTLTGPVPGEGWAQGFNGGIELHDFKIGFSAEKIQTQNIAEHAKGILGLAKEISFDMNLVEITKRFDVSSPAIMMAIDNDLKIVSATISVIGMMHTGKPMHEPGFILQLTDGYFIDINTRMVGEGKGASVIENIKMGFNSVVMTYMKDTHTSKDSYTRIPTQPFLFKKQAF